MRTVIGLGDIRELLKTDKAVKILLIAGAALILLAALGGLFGHGGTGESGTSRSVRDFEEYERELEKRLSAILSEIDGIGDVNVMVTLDTAGRTEYGKNSDMRISVTAPQVRGVIVVCGGGDSIAIREKVVNAVTGVFGISTTRVSVAGGG
ncbi:MAG: hypothetical protein IK990_16250 [Ruminiclostridium sp.]|nr:hypothetical protein [Ruminiclostridium sp.]